MYCFGFWTGFWTECWRTYLFGGIMMSHSSESHGTQDQNYAFEQRATQPTPPVTQPSPTHMLVPKPVWNEDNEYILDARVLGGVWMTHGGAFYAQMSSQENSDISLHRDKAEARAWVETQAMKQLGAVEYTSPVDLSARVKELEAENAALASWQCIYLDGVTGLTHDDHANATCVKDKRIAELEAENALLQEILDSRPAINAGLPDTYIRWSQALYSGEVIRAALAKGDGE
jgi:hypothetical protein